MDRKDAWCPYCNAKRSAADIEDGDCVICGTPIEYSNGGPPAVATNGEVTRLNAQVTRELDALADLKKPGSAARKPWRSSVTRSDLSGVNEASGDVYVAKGLYSDLRLLDTAEGKVVIEYMEVVSPACHPHTNYSLVAMRLRRCRETVRVLFPIAENRAPVLEEKAALSDFFTVEEKEIIFPKKDGDGESASGRAALRLPKWIGSNEESADER